MKNKLAIELIKKYQQNKHIFGRGHCHFYPSCSNYAIECYQKFNFFYASFLTLFRIIRCTPFTKRQYDPVPLSKKEKKQKRVRDEFINKYSKPFFLALLNASSSKDIETLFDEYIYPDDVNKNVTIEDDLFFTPLSSTLGFTSDITKVPNKQFSQNVTKEKLIDDFKKLVQNDIIKNKNILNYHFSTSFNPTYSHKHFISSLSYFSIEEILTKYIKLPSSGIIVVSSQIPTEFLNFFVKQNNNIIDFSKQKHIKNDSIKVNNSNNLDIVIVQKQVLPYIIYQYPISLTINFYTEEQDYNDFADYNFKINSEDYNE